MMELDYDETGLAVGDVLTVDVTVTNLQDRSIQMALVELVAPVGMQFDTETLDDLLDEGIVDNVEYDGDTVRLYINDVVAEDPVEFHYAMVAVEKANVTWGGNRVFDMYNALVDTELAPIDLDIGPA
jgi:hypothetical protein